MLWLLAIAAIALPIYGSIPESDDNVLHIGGIFPIAGEGGWQGGQVRFGYLKKNKYIYF